MPIRSVVRAAFGAALLMPAHASARDRRSQMGDTLRIEAWKVEERVADHWLSLPDGRIQRFTEVEIRPGRNSP